MRKYQVSVDLRSNHERELQSFENSVNKAEKSLDSLTKGFPNPFSGATRGVTRFLGSLGPVGAGLGLVTAGMTAATVAGAAFTRQYSIAAERTTVAEEALFNFNAELQALSEGAELEDLQEAILNVSERFGEATRDAGAIRDAMLAIGFSQDQITDLNFEGPEAQLEAIRTQFQGIATDSERIFRARELFAEDGLRILNLITAEADQLEAIQARNQSLGISVDQQVFDDFRALRLEVGLTGRAAQAFAINLGGAFAPDFTSLFTNINDTIALFGGTENAASAIANALQPIASIISATGKTVFFLATAFVDVKREIQEIIDIVPSINDLVESIVPESVLRRTREFGAELRETQSGTNLRIQRRYIEGQLEVAESSGAATEELEALRQQLDIIADGLSEGGRTAIQARQALRELREEAGAVAQDVEEMDTAFAKLLDSVAGLRSQADIQLRPEVTGVAEARENLDSLAQAQERLDGNTGISDEERSSAQDQIDSTRDRLDQILQLELANNRRVLEGLSATDSQRLRIQRDFQKKREQLSAIERDGDVLGYEEYLARFEELSRQEDAELSKLDAKRAESSRRNQERLAREAQALDTLRANLLGQIDRFGEVDRAFDDQISKIQEALSREAISGPEAEQLRLVATIEAEVNRERLVQELDVLDRTAQDVSQINIPIRLTDADSAASEVSRILSQIDQDRAEVEENFDRTFRINPEAAQALRDALSADIDLEGAEALQNVLQSLNGLEIVPDINLADGIQQELQAIQGPIAELEDQLNNAINSGDGDTARDLELLITTLEDQGLREIQEAAREGYNIDLQVNTSGDGFDEDSQNFLDSLQSAQAEIDRVEDKLSGGFGAADAFQEGFSEAQRLEDGIAALQLEFPEGDFSNLTQQAGEVAKNVADSFKAEFDSILNSIGSGGSELTGFLSATGAFDNLSPALSAATEAALGQAEALFGDFFSDRAAQEQRQFQDSLVAFQTAEQEKSAFAAVQEDFRAATSQADIDAATGNLNNLLNQYQVTNDELNQLGLDRSSSAQQISRAIANARAGETEALRKQAQAQEAQAKKAFETDKTFKRAQVIASGIESVQNSYAFGSRIGGPIGGAAAAALAIAFSAKQLSAINSLSFAGSGGSLSASAPGFGGGIAQAGSSSGVGQIDSATDAIDSSSSLRPVSIDFQGRSSITTEEAKDMAIAMNGVLKEGLDLDFIE